jgi:hypothetical protein
MSRNASAFIALFAVVLLPACEQAATPAASAAPQHKVGVLLINHGSRQKLWRDKLVEVEDRVRDRIMALPDVKAVRTAFNEYTDPSIAQQMKAFDDEGFDEVVVVPLFLTIGGHVNSDLPNLLGIKNDPKALETLPGKGIPVYRPRARVVLLETIDSDEFLKANILRRTKQLLKDDDGKQYGVTLAAYGDDKFNQQWEALMGTIGEHLKQNLGIDAINYAWSGHLVNYSMDPTRKAVNQILDKKKKDIVISVYVACDPKFQRDVIGEGVRHSERPQDVMYVETESILPDDSLNNWVVESVRNGLNRGGPAGSG